MDGRVLGKKGEDVACKYLEQKGFKIIERNFWTNIGEIDIIAQKRFTLLNKIQRILGLSNNQNLFNRAIHFIEVKSLANSAGDFFPEQRADYKKQKKLKRLAEIWLIKNKYPESFPYQIDIAGVSINTHKKMAKVYYFYNV